MVANEKSGQNGRRNGGPWTELQREVGQDASRRQSVIRAIEKMLGAKVVTMFTAFNSSSGIITDSEAEMLENVLAAECVENQPLILVINSPGGLALAAERIANVCRAYSADNRFRVIVPHMAKSAASMVCFGAEQILMSKTAELGPVDPQVPFSDDKGTERWISAEEYARSYDSLMKDASSGNFPRIEPFLQQLNRYDSRFIEQLRSAQSLSADISVRLLQSGMMKTLSSEEIESKIEVFLTQGAKKSHGRMITALEARNCGLNIDILDLRSALWRQVWKLYIKTDWATSMQCSAIVESTATSVMKPR